MYFRLGGGTLKGVSKPGADRLDAASSSMDGMLHVDLGRATSSSCRRRRRERRLAPRHRSGRSCTRSCTAITRDQFMARHKSNHLQVAYAPDDGSADRALGAKAAMLAELGLRVHLCGDVG